MMLWQLPISIFHNYRQVKEVVEADKQDPNLQNSGKTCRAQKKNGQEIAESSCSPENISKNILWPLGVVERQPNGSVKKYSTIGLIHFLKSISFIIHDYSPLEKLFESS